MYKFSFYNIIVPDNTESKYVTIFNSASEAIIKLEKDIYNHIASGVFNETIPYFNDLVKQGIIVPSEVDEYEKVIFKEKAEQLKLNSKFVIIIAPTLKCNFKCVYCFENDAQKSGLMSQDTMEGIISFVQRNIVKRPGLKTIHVQWFGGEPLLAFQEVILPLSKRFIELCSSNDIKYEASIITNGFLLNDNIIKQLINTCEVSKFQITFDGTQEKYCTRKQVKPEVYDIVKNHVFNLSNYAFHNKRSVAIHLRLNVDKYNINDAYSFVDELKSDERFLPNIFFYLGRLRNAYNKNMPYFSTSEFCNETLRFNAYAHQKQNMKLTKKIWCIQYTINSVNIGPSGELYKCEHFFGQADKVVGNIYDGIFYNQAYVSYMNQPHTKKCRMCKIFPICIGGCPAERYQTNDVSCEYTTEYCIEAAKAYLLQINN